MKMDERPIGFFDSGVGGISVLREAIKLMPKENYVYFGDSINAPYGMKSVEEVQELSFKAAEFLMSKGIKALVVACNTATSAAILELRARYSDIPVIGIEPALKPAIELNRAGKIIIMATPMTLAEGKFSDLMSRYGNDEGEIRPLPCPGLVELIENGIIDGLEIENYLKKILAYYMKGDIAAIVLGCTHYPFIKGSISKVLGSDVPIIHGSLGTANQLKKLLGKEGLLNFSSKSGTVEIYNSLNTEEINNLGYKLLLE